MVNFELGNTRALYPLNYLAVCRTPVAYEVMGSIPVGDSDFSLPHACVM